MVTGDLFSIIRSLVEDPNGDFVTDSYILSKMQATQNEVVAKVFMNPNVPGIRTSVVIPNVAAYVTSLRKYFETGSQLETLIDIFDMWERATGQLDTDWVPFSPVASMPVVTQGTLNRLYVWELGDIKLPGATQATDIRIYGEFRPQALTSNESPLIPSTETALQYGTARLIAAGRGNTTLFTFYNTLFEQTRAALFNSLILDQQVIPIRNRPRRRSDFNWP